MTIVDVISTHITNLIERPEILHLLDSLIDMPRPKLRHDTDSNVLEDEPITRNRHFK